MGKIPSVVASYLKLPDVACYTGHCLRRSSATLLADAGVDITTIKRHAGWKSTTVAEGYVENSIENKTKIANQVLVGTTTSAITKTVNERLDGEAENPTDATLEGSNLPITTVPRPVCSVIFLTWYDEIYKHDTLSLCHSVFHP
ncbi:hypothetical protein NQ317_007662 [Molorchus minor]|uniref:Tyr recombinase domain-containing protein n=1 Tax=Molorchus minor TaxID=1323400 RepID=A0ABQ9IZY7_9CUCU|nr:hypothetical protein NQ317_007662 [Molorchus minor]